MINILYKSLLPQHVYIPLREHPALCVFHFVYVPLPECSTPWESRFYTSLCLYPTPMIYPIPISHSYTPLLYPAPISHPVCPTPCSIPCIFYFVYALLFHSVCTHSICVPILVNFLSVYSTLCVFYSLRDSHCVFYSLCTFLFVCRTKGVGHE